MRELDRNVTGRRRLGLLAGLDVGWLLLARTWGAELNRGHPLEEMLVPTLIGLFLLHRIARGGSMAYGFRPAFAAYASFAVVAGTPVPVEAYPVGLLGFLRAELAILLSPSVRQLVRRPAVVEGPQAV